MLLESDLVWGQRWTSQTLGVSISMILNQKTVSKLPPLRRFHWSPGSMNYFLLCVFCSNFYYLVFLIFFFFFYCLIQENSVSFIFIPTTRHNESLIKLSVGKGMKRQSECLTIVTNQRLERTRKRGRIQGKTCPKAASSEGKGIMLAGKTSRNIPGGLGTWACKHCTGEWVKRRN